MSVHYPGTVGVVAFMVGLTTGLTLWGQPRATILGAAVAAPATLAWWYSPLPNASPGPMGGTTDGGYWGFSSSEGGEE